MFGTSQGDAAGFELNFLTKLVEIKSSQPRLNMLHMIIKDIPNEQVIIFIHDHVIVTGYTPYF